MTRMLPKRRVSGFASRLATATSRGIALLPLEGLAPRSGRSVIPGRHPERRGHTHERQEPHTEDRFAPPRPVLTAEVAESAENGLTHERSSAASATSAVQFARVSSLPSGRPLFHSARGVRDRPGRAGCAGCGSCRSCGRPLRPGCLPVPPVLDARVARSHRPNTAPLPGRRRFLASAPAALRSE